MSANRPYCSKNVSCHSAFYEGGLILMIILTPIKAIRAKCLDCSCGQVKEIRLCPVTKCPLWPYRMGKRPAKQIKMQLVESIP